MSTERLDTLKTQLTTLEHQVRDFRDLADKEPLNDPRTLDYLTSFLQIATHTLDIALDHAVEQFPNPPSSYESHHSSNA